MQLRAKELAAGVMLPVLLALACAGSGPFDTIAESEASSSTPNTASVAEPPTPTPLTEIDPEQLPEPEPGPEEADGPKTSDEPLPFNDEQLERIRAVQSIVAAASTAYGVDPTLIEGLIWVESKFEPRAKGPAGAQGLMQLMPKTASSLAKRLDRKRNSWDPDFNIHAGTLMLSRLLARFDGDVRLALVGYNRGGGTVSKWVDSGKPFPEGAETFVARVLEAQAKFRVLDARAPAPTAPPTPTPDPES